ncbi:hypothetical protein ACFS3C_03080 [Azotobacter vinelandii]
MHRIPRDKGLDSTLALLHDPYRFIARRCRLHGSNLFETRLLLRKTLCMSGAEAARLFYDPERFVRHGAMPPRLQKTLFGVGGVQGLDGEAHRHRKHMFVALLMDAERVAQLVEAVRGEWRTCARRWERMEKGGALRCAWAGIPLAEEEAGPRAREIALLFDYAGSVGPKHWRSRLARRRSEAWMGALVESIRASRRQPPAETAAQVISWHRGLDGNLLEARCGRRRIAERHPAGRGDRRLSHLRRPCIAPLSALPAWPPLRRCRIPGVVRAGGAPLLSLLPGRGRARAAGLRVEGLRLSRG